MPISINGKTYKAIIFDLDDTLVDTSKSYDEVIKRTVQQYTSIEVDDADLHLLRTYGIPYGVNNDWNVTWLLIDLITHFPKTDWQSILQNESLNKVDCYSKKYLEIKEFFQSLYLGNPPFNGHGLIDRAEKRLYNDNFFPALKKQDIKIAIVTGRATPEALHTIKNIHGLIPKFINEESWVIASDSVDSFGKTIPEKPSSEPIIECVKRLNLKPIDCVYVGNSMSDYIATKNVPIDFIQVGLSNIVRGKEVKLFNYMKFKNVGSIFHSVE
jgi:phosphoglycolate phosphatase-like HAD superfamily hydrolase